MSAFLIKFNLQLLSQLNMEIQGVKIENVEWCTNNLVAVYEKQKMNKYVCTE